MKTLRTLGTYEGGNRSLEQQDAQSLINTELTRISSMEEGIDKEVQRQNITNSILAGHFLPSNTFYRKNILKEES